MLSGLNFLHRKQWSHGLINSGYIFFTSNVFNKCKILFMPDLVTDFDSIFQVGSPEFRQYYAPETLADLISGRRPEYMEVSDAYCLGMLILDMCCIDDTRSCYKKQPPALDDQIFNKKMEFIHYYYSKKLRHFLNQLLVDDMNERKSFVQLLEIKDRILHDIHQTGLQEAPLLKLNVISQPLSLNANSQFDRELEDNAMSAGSSKSHTWVGGRANAVPKDNVGPHAVALQHHEGQPSTLIAKNDKKNMKVA